MATESAHQEQVEATGAQWLVAARAFVVAWLTESADAVPSVRQRQAAESERLWRAAFDRALADRRHHHRGEPHGE